MSIFDKHKEKFSILIRDVNKYDNFDNILAKIEDTTIKGDYFEIFCKLYFMLLEENKYFYNKIYLNDEIPISISQHLNISLEDQKNGKDGIILTNDNKFFAFQCKFRTNKKIIPWGDEIAKFQACVFGCKIKNIEKAIFFTNCKDVCKELKDKDKYINITYDLLVERCNGDFWNKLRYYLTNNGANTPPLTYEPYDYQLKIIKIAGKYFRKYNYGRLYLACGTGKTLLSTFISLNELKYSKIFIAVPSLYLLTQTFKVWSRQISSLYSDILDRIIYLDNKWTVLLIGSDIEDDKYATGYTLTTDKEIIRKKLLSAGKNIIVITTYHSSHLLKEGAKEINFKFDIGIYDEAHRTVGIESRFNELLEYEELSEKRLFMTATEKKCSYFGDQDVKIYSMTDEEIYGKVIFNYSLHNAIFEKRLVDYKIIAPFMYFSLIDQIIDSVINSGIKNSKEFIKQKNIVEIEENTDLKNFDTGNQKKLILASLVILRMFEEGKIKHLLVFSNSREKGCQFIKIFKILMSDKSTSIVCEYLDGNDNMNKRRSFVKEFEESGQGIISSVRIFNEGIDIPICDSACFIDDKNSKIEIMQCVGRVLRLCPSKPNKIAYIILPIMIDENEENILTNSDPSFNKIRKVLKTLAEHDGFVREKFILCDYNMLVDNLFFNNLSLNNSSLRIENTMLDKFDINELSKSILTKIFNKNGDKENYIRNKLIYENEKRYFNEEELIDTKEKCVTFLKGINRIFDPVVESEEKIEEINPQNWVKYCLGDRIFSIIAKKYYDTEKSLLEACEKLGITNYDFYKNMYMQDPKLPSPEYIGDGFYHYMNNNFNITLLLAKKRTWKDKF